MDDAEDFEEDDTDSDDIFGKKDVTKSVTFVALDILRIVKLFQAPNITIQGQNCQTSCGNNFTQTSIERSKKGKKVFVNFQGPFKEKKCKKHLTCPYTINSENKTDTAFFTYNATALFNLAEVQYNGMTVDVSISCPIQFGISHGFKSFPIALSRNVPYDEKSPKGQCSLCVIKADAGKFIHLEISQLPVRFWLCKHGKKTIGLNISGVKKIL